MRAKRYYAECALTAALFNSGWQRSWQVFDRESLTPQGACIPIALATSRNQAFLIRDALNERKSDVKRA